MNNKSYLKIIYVFVFVVIITQIVGCKKIDEYKAINTAKNFHYYIQQEDYKKAYELIINKPAQDEVVDFNDEVMKDKIISFEEFRSHFGKFEKSVFVKRVKIKKIKVSSYKKNTKIIRFLLDAKSFEFELWIYVKKVDNSWKILNFSIPVS